MAEIVRSESERTPDAFSQRASFANLGEGADRDTWLYSYNPLTVKLIRIVPVAGITIESRCSTRTLQACGPVHGDQALDVIEQRAENGEIPRPLLTKYSTTIHTDFTSCS
jgi:hypothetical protein